MTRFPRNVYDTSDEPDLRFSLANECTFGVALGCIGALLALSAEGALVALLRLADLVISPMAAVFVVARTVAT